MTVKNQDIDMYSGDDLDIYVNVLTADGSKKDLTGCSIKYAIMGLPGQTPDIIKDNAALGGISIVNAQEGQFRVTLDSEDTETLKGRFYHVARVTDTLDKKAVVMTGTVNILEAGI